MRKQVPVVQQSFAWHENGDPMSQRPCKTACRVQGSVLPKLWTGDQGTGLLATNSPQHCRRVQHEQRPKRVVSLPLQLVLRASPEVLQGPSKLRHQMRLLHELLVVQMSGLLVPLGHLRCHFPVIMKFSHERRLAEQCAVTGTD